jgi:flagellar basal-body rod modification protein FlgD
MQGVVDGVDVSGSEPFILIGDLRIPLSSISAVHAPSSGTDPDPDADPETPEQEAA